MLNLITNPVAKQYVFLIYMEKTLNSRNRNSQETTPKFMYLKRENRVIVNPNVILYSTFWAYIHFVNEVPI